MVCVDDDGDSEEELVLCPPPLSPQTPNPTLGLTKRVAFTCLVVADREQRRQPRPPRPYHSINEEKK